VLAGRDEEVGFQMQFAAAAGTARPDEVSAEGLRAFTPVDRLTAFAAVFGTGNQFGRAVRTFRPGIELRSTVQTEIGLGGKFFAARRADVLAIIWCPHR